MIGNIVTYAQALEAARDQYADALAQCPCPDSYDALLDKVEAQAVAYCRAHGIEIPQDAAPLRGLGCAT